MTEKIAKLLQMFLYALLSISALIIVIFYIKGESAADIIIYWAYFLLILTIAISVIAPIIFYIKNPGKAKTVLTGIVVFVVLFVIAYLLASGSIQGDVYQKYAITANISQIIGGMLITTYILGGLAILAIIYASIAKFFK